MHIRDATVPNEILFEVRNHIGFVTLNRPAALNALTLGGWRAVGLYAVLWVLPAVTVLQAILRLRAVCEHGAVADLSSPLTAARTHIPSFTVPWLLARSLLFPHHVNYHIEHHLYPAVPHYHLRRLHALLASRGLLEGGDLSGIGTTIQKIFADPAQPGRGVRTEEVPAR
jgi:fatty acid desaturase